MRLDFPNLTQPIQKTVGHGGAGGTARETVPLTRPTLHHGTWDTVGQKDRMPHLPHQSESEVGQKNTSISAAVPCAPPVPPQKSNAVEKTDPLADFIDEVEERAAIMEYDGGLSRTEAEARAREDCKKAHGL